MVKLSILRRGFTVVEAIVAIAILGLVASSLIPLMVQGFSEVFVAGGRIRAVHEAQQAIDTKARSGTSGSGDSLTITFPGNESKNIGSISGEEIEVPIEIVPGRTASVTAFIPK